MTALRDIAVFVLGRGLQVLAALITIRAATTILSPGGLGSVNQVMSLAVLPLSALVAPVSAYIGRGFLEWLERGSVPQYLGSYVRLVLAMVVALALAGWVI